MSTKRTEAEVYREAPTQMYRKTFIFKGETGVYLYLKPDISESIPNIYLNNPAKLFASSMKYKSAFLFRQ